MNEGQTASRSKFHEAPLVVFSALVSAGAGTGVTHFVFALSDLASFLPPSGLPALIACLLAIGLLASMAHLGRPGGVTDGLRRIGRSPLSNEGAVAVLALAGAALSSIVPDTNFLFAPVWYLTVGACVGTLISLGAVYRIPGRPGWGGGVVFQPLIAGMIAGWVLWRMAAPGPMPFPFFAILIILVLTDLGITASRILVLAGHREESTPSHPQLFALRNTLLLLRCLFVDLLPLLFAATGHWSLATVAVAVGVFVDRTSFYGLGLKETTEAEIARVEGILESLPD
ncbi:DmsC/YnfH family molybdoenzyme membrane anchor subunit [Gemmatimonadota bacterium]